MFKKWKEARQLRFEESVKSLLKKIEKEKQSEKESNSNESKPYIIHVKNTHETECKNVNLLGFNKFFNKPNFGNEDCIVFNNEDYDYGHLLATTATKPFLIGKLRFQSSTSSQLIQKFMENVSFANGFGLTKIINLSIQKDAYQYQSDILDVNNTFIVDGDSYFSILMPPKTTLYICIFPIAQFNPSEEFNEYFDAKRLSGNNFPPVNIETRCQCEEGKCEKGFKLNFLQKAKKFFIELKAKVKQKVSQLKNK